MPSSNSFFKGNVTNVSYTLSWDNWIFEEFLSESKFSAFQRFHGIIKSLTGIQHSDKVDSSVNYCLLWSYWCMHWLESIDKTGTGRMAQWEKFWCHEPWNLNLITRSHCTRGEQTLQSCPVIYLNSMTHVCLHVCPNSAYTDTAMKNKIEIKGKSESLQCFT